MSLAASPSVLQPLRRRLESVRSRRRIMRCLQASLTLLLTLSVLLLIVFPIDYLFEPGIPTRVVLWIVSVIVIGVVWRRAVWPKWSHRESLSEIALLIEQRQGIDSDLIAALQFEGYDRTAGDDRFGSPQLTDAVVRYVADVGDDLPLSDAVDREKTASRGFALTAAIVVIALAVVFAPQTSEVFLRRLFTFSTERYPTETVITAVTVNGIAAPLRTRDAAGLETLRFPTGRPLRFDITSGGATPATGEVRIVGSDSGATTNVALDATEEENIFAGELPSLTEPVTATVYLGDARTDRFTIELVPQPVVTLTPKPIVPEYARTATETNPTGSRLQLSVLEGTSVPFELTATNKSLRNAAIVVNNQEYPLEKSSAERSSPEVWSLAPEGTPFEAMTQAVRYELTIEDEDGLGLSIPVRGYIGIRPDHPPRVAAYLVFDRYLPKAKPRIEFGVMDDFGIASLAARVQVVRQDVRNNRPQTAPEPIGDGTGSERNAESSDDDAGMAEEKTVPIPIGSGTDSVPTLAKSSFSIPLTPFDLEPGDELKVTLVATDERGSREGQTTLSEPYVIRIVDRVEFNKTLQETDRLSAGKIDAIIQQQLGLGD